MADRESGLTVSYTPTALRHLDAIWEHNTHRYSPDHADDYVVFLRSSADRLATDTEGSRPVPTYPDYRYVVIRRAARGHGHLAVYALIEGRVEVLAFYHTAQDWPGRIARGEV